MFEPIISLITDNPLQTLSLSIIGFTAILGWRTERFQRQTALREALENIPLYKFDNSAKTVAQPRLHSFKWYPILSKHPLRKETKVAIKFLHRATAKNDAASVPDSINYEYEEGHFDHIGNIENSEFDDKRKEVKLEVRSVDPVKVRNSTEDALKVIRDYK